MSPAPRVRRARLLVASAALAVVSAACGTAPSATSTVPPTTGAGPTPADASPTTRGPGATAAAPTPSVPVAPTTTLTTTSAPAPAGPAPGPGPGTQATYAVQAQPAPGTCHYRWVGAYPLPDPSCTPGAVNPQVTTADLGTTICRAGWTATVRPPENVTGPEKDGSAAAYGYTGSFSTGEYDHLVPLELGGDPNAPSNLWLEPNDRAGASTVTNTKDGLENRLRALVCAGQLSLGAAQEAIATDWVAALQRYGG